MGVVYMAEQTQPVRRKVALKIIKPGMDSQQVIARFEAERQALAMMDHPNIAKVLDAGATDDGPALLRHGAGPRHPDHRLLRPRAALDPRAAGAVRPGLPGRAARPPEGDHPPRPQALEHPGDRASTACRCPRSSTSASPRPPARASPRRRSSPASHQLVGTPLYMSPEQAELARPGRRHPQRHLLAGRAALRAADRHDAVRRARRSGKAAFDEMRRIIREEEPPTPEHAAELARARRSRPSRRTARCRPAPAEPGGAGRARLDRDEGAGEGPRRRYETANDFAADVMRYLTDQPVEACPPSAVVSVRASSPGATGRP